MPQIAVIERTVTGGTIKCDVAPHPNVAFRETIGTYKGKRSKTEEGIMAACKFLEFTKYLNKDVNDNDEDTVRIILLQITHAARHIKKQQFPNKHQFPEVQITMADLRVTEFKKKVVLLHPSFVQQQGDHKVKQPTKLGKVFAEILQIKNITTNISKDLLKSTKDSKTLGEILQHPYFWRTEKILRFFNAIVQRGKEDQESGEELKKKINDIQNPEIFTQKGWIEDLAIGAEEIDKYNTVLKEKVKDKGIEGVKEEEVKEDTIKTLKTQHAHGKPVQMGETRKPKDRYKPMSVFSLVNFIRNFSMHFWKQNDAVKACFLFDAVEGYWQFFKRRFPNLLHFVYNAVKELEFKDDGLRFFLEEIEPNQDLDLKD